MRLLLTRGQRLGLFACISIIGFVIASGLMAFVMYKWGLNVKALRVGAVVQDVVMFILPPIAVAVLVTRQPAALLCLRRPPLIPTLLAIFTLLAALPVMNFIVAANQQLTLPQSLAPIEEWMRQSEAQAQETINAMLLAPGVGALIVSILIVGVMAGLSEELFFRAGLQRLLATGGMGRAAAIWLTAFIFSALHLQFFGFVPRLLLGAFFGYLLIWSGSIWVPIIAHAFNNTLYIVMVYIYGPDAETTIFNSLGTEPTDWIYIVASIAIVAWAMVLLYRMRIQQPKGNPIY